MREFRDFEAMINIEIVVIGIQFFFLSLFFLCLVLSPIREFKFSSVFVIKYIYQYDLSSIKISSLSRCNLRSRFKFDHRVLILPHCVHFLDGKAADGKQSNCNFDRNREERLWSVRELLGRREGKSRKRIPPLSCRWRLICRIRLAFSESPDFDFNYSARQSAHDRSMGQVFDRERSR